MQNKKPKILDEYWAHELGLPILLKGVPVVYLEGNEVIDIDYEQLSETLFAALILKPYSLTGAEVRFMRFYMELTLEQLAAKLHVTHASVLTWEKCKNNPTKMTASTETMLRLFAAKQGVKDHELIEVILDHFFEDKSAEQSGKRASTIVEFNTRHQEELPIITFTPEEDGLSEVQEA